MANESNIGFYVPLSLEDLKERYPCLKVQWMGSSGKRATSIVSGSGQRLVFFVAGDGSQSLLYHTIGCGEVVRNTMWDFKEVIGVHDSRVFCGRIQYKETADSQEWVDVGPVLKSGVHETDPDFEVTRKMMLRSRETSSKPKEKKEPKNVKEVMERNEQVDPLFGDLNDW